MKSSVKRRPITQPVLPRDTEKTSSRPSTRKASRGRSGRFAHYEHQIAALKASLEHVQGQLEVTKRALAREQAAKEPLDEAWEKMPMPYIVHDASGYIVRMNGIARTLLGVAPHAHSRTSLVRAFSNESLLRWFEHMRACVCTKKPVTSEVVLRVGRGGRSEFDLLTMPGARLHAGRPAFFYSVLLDRDRVTEIQREKQEYYQRLIDLIEGIVWEAEPQDLQVTFVSKYARKLLGYPLTEWSRPGFWQSRIFVEDRERVLDALHRILPDRKELRIDYRAITADRRLIWLHDSIRLVEYDGKSKLHGVAIDVSEQHEAEEQIRSAHAFLEERVAERTTELRRTVADLEGFSYSLSHDMRAPIRAMQGYASLVKEMAGDKLGPQPSQFLQRIMESAERLDLLVRDVLKYSSTARAPLELKPVPLQPLIDGILHEFPALEAKQASIQVEQPLPCVLAHEAFVGQALSNLLTNAVKFVPKGKSPCVRVRTEPVRGGASGRVEPWVRIWVEDNGLGIAPEDQGRIFRFFERVYPDDQYEGTGMGLAIVQKAVERLGGRVGVESKPGEGSRFWIELRQA